MRYLFNIKFVFVLLWFLPFIFLHGLMMPNEIHGKEPGFFWGIYEKNLPAPDMTDALLDVREFFNALCEGRIDVLREMMDESLLDEYQLSLNDPSYPSLLRKIYGGSKITIKRIYKKEGGSFEIEAHLITPKSGTNEVLFEIEKDKKKRGLSPPNLRSFDIKQKWD